MRGGIERNNNLDTQLTQAFFSRAPALHLHHHPNSFSLFLSSNLFSPYTQSAFTLQDAQKRNFNELIHKFPKSRNNPKLKKQVKTDLNQPQIAIENFNSKPQIPQPNQSTDNIHTQKTHILIKRKLTCEEGNPAACSDQ